MKTPTIIKGPTDLHSDDGVDSPTHRPRSRLVKVVLILIAAACFLVGGALTVAGTLQGGGYFTSDYGQLSTTSAAMVTREVDVEGRRPTDPQNDPGDLARVRIQVKQADPDKPAFVGVAKRADVERYLAGVQYDEMSTFTLDPLKVTWTRHEGRASAPPPGAQTFWAATAKRIGPGEMELQWNKSLGEWMAVAMNADGSPAVHLSANIGLRFGFLLPVGIGLLIVAVGVAGSLIFVRQRPSRASTHLQHSP